ncbi:type II toxin-antitoxin system RelE/ParE family toxin [Glycocaulis alkaliphilus]|uniref:type II toxin-antitoxin system RelE/ParE family toxin n=1 Tax=Glycocaulis alkaliphilus TaxID=1434191 RepID=UPI000FD6BF58|nr:type II toxin-antitoxin system RelE/ParE family toxin [Glycocaulis alkaliphilus]GGB68706.1 hypothetical protein GCM10007417_05610 [Glycocaulis alkaliphilus]
MAVRFTSRAVAALVDIADWTFDRFGPEQVQAYRLELLDACQSLPAPSPLDRRLHGLRMRGEGEVVCRRASMHFIVFRRTGRDVEILDFLHVRSDLAARLKALETER